MNILVKRVQLIRAIIKAENHLNYNHALSNAIRANRDHMLSFSQDDNRKVSYAQKPDQTYSIRSRMKTKLQRYLLRNYEHLVSSYDIDNFARLVFSFSNSCSNDITIISGYDIVDAYNDGFGEETCMTGDESAFVKMFADNSSVVSLLKYDDGDTEARALLWHIDGDVLVDRIYPNDGYHIEYINRWAEEQGYLCRENNYAPESKKVCFKGDKTYSVRLSTTQYYPYLDSFSFIKNKKDGFATFSNDPDGCEYVAYNTNGRLRKVRGVCLSCGYLISEENDYNITDDGDRIHVSCEGDY